MLKEHLADYQEHHYQERHHQYLKNKALKEYFVPTLIDLIHLRHEEPTNVREHLQYIEERNALITTYTGRMGTRRTRLFIRLLNNHDNWTSAGVTLSRGEDVEQLLTWDL
ncbi:hypothetical protein [Absidia glauca]|uniref:Uncharacterized protein n=1 Tax=Absidia glauca TaxID=4829 RepID=A0A168R6V6_ABSGL|nr:hypothetical protein [Absidia glauca]